MRTKIMSVSCLLMITILGVFTGLNATNHGPFIKNIGQIKNQYGEENKDVLYIYHANNFSVSLKKDGYSFETFNIERDGGIFSNRIDVDWKNSNTQKSLETVSAKTILNIYSKSSYLNIPTYEKIIYKNVYPNIDVVFYTQDNSVKFEYIIHPGGNPKDIQQVYSGVHNISLSENGSIILENDLTKIFEAAPISFNSNHLPIKSNYLLNDNIVSYELENYDLNNTIIIDPTITWSTYMGSDSLEIGYSVQRKKGSVFMVGQTNSIQNFSTVGAYQQNFGGGNTDAYISKYNNNGDKLWTTYFGGNGDNSAQSCVIDVDYNIYIAGFTTNDSVIGNGAIHQPVYGGGIYDGFIAKFDSSGVLLWSTYYGGSEEDVIYGISLDTLTNTFFVGGYSESINSIATPGSHQPSIGGGRDGFIAGFNSIGVRLWGTYYGGSSTDIVHDIAFNQDSLFIVGTTHSGNNIAGVNSGVVWSGPPFGYKTTLSGLSDAFVVKMTKQGERWWATYFGGESTEEGLGIDADECGNIAITGTTNSLTGISYGTTIHQFLKSGAQDAYIAKFEKVSALVLSTYFGGSGNDVGTSIEISPIENYFKVSGYTTSSDLSNTGLLNSYSGGEDAFSLDLYRDGSVRNCRYFGGSGNDRAYDIHGENPFYVCGYTNSNQDIALGNAAQDTLAGLIDAFLYKVYVAPRLITVGNCLISPQNCQPVGPLCAPAYLMFQPPLFDDEPGANSYFWQFPGGIPSTSTDQYPIIYYPTGGIYYVYLTVSNPAGQVDIQTSFILYDTPDLDVYSSKTSICEGECVTIYADSDYPVFWPDLGIWADSIVVCPGVTTTYTATAENNGCDTTVSITIYVTPKPNVIAYQDTIICEGSSVQLLAIGATNFQWLPGNYLNNSNIPNPISTPPVGTIIYTVIGDNGPACEKDSDEVTIQVLPNPDLTITSSANDICDNTCITLYGNSTGTIYWPSVGIWADSIIVCPTSSTNFSATSSNGICSISDDIFINVLPSPELIISNDTNICIGESAPLNVDGAINYQWTPSLYLNSNNISNPISTPTNTITYSVIGQNNFGCYDTAQVTVTVFEYPTLSIQTSTPGVCENQCLTLFATSDGSVFWNDLGVWGDSVVDCPTTAIDYVVTAFNGPCKISDSISLSLLPSPVIEAKGDTTICAGTSTYLHVEGAESYTWSPSNYLDNPNSNNPISTPFADIIYLVTGYNSYGCPDTATVRVKTVKDPYFMVDFNYVVDSCTQEVYFNPSYENGVSYLWNFGNENNSSDKNPVYIFSGDEDSYTVSATIYKESVCPNYPQVMGYVEKEIEIEVGVKKLFIPNIFTPNSDQLNNIFEPQFTQNCKNYDLEIFNRWGVKILSKEFTTSANITTGWNGKVENEFEEVPEGVYYYIVSLKNYEDKIIQKYHGSVTLLR